MKTISTTRIVPSHTKSTSNGIWKTTLILLSISATEDTETLGGTETQPGRSELEERMKSVDRNESILRSFGSMKNKRPKSERKVRWQRATIKAIWRSGIFLAKASIQFVNPAGEWKSTSVKKMTELEDWQNTDRTETTKAATILSYSVFPLGFLRLVHVRSKKNLYEVW